MPLTVLRSGSGTVIMGNDGKRLKCFSWQATRNFEEAIGNGKQFHKRRSDGVVKEVQ